MATNIRIIHARDFLRATPEGPYDLDKSKKLLIEIATASAAMADYEILVDMRSAHVKMSAADVFFLANELVKHYKAFATKTAVLCPVKDFDNAGFFALCAQNRGFRLKAFTAFEEAIEWLTEGRTGG